MRSNQFVSNSRARAARRERIRASNCVSERLESRRLLSGGDIDTTFGSNGRATLDVPAFSDDYVASIVALPGGGFLAAHNSRISDNQETVSFSRHLPDGRLDPSFGSGGLLRLADTWGTVAIGDMFLRGNGRSHGRVPRVPMSHRRVKA